MPLLNYTTQIDPDKTAGQIAKMLREAGARAVLTEYDEKGDYITSLSFKMSLNGRELGFRLPCDWKPVLKILEEDKKVAGTYCNREQAVRVAWRIVHSWVKSQLAIIETKMVRTEEVFLPYVIMPDGRTLSEKVVDDPRFILGSGDNQNKTNE